MIVMDWCLLMSREAVSFVSFLCYDGDGVVFLDVAGDVDRGRGYRGIGPKQTNFLLLSVIRNGKNIRDLDFFLPVCKIALQISGEQPLFTVYKSSKLEEVQVCNMSCYYNPMVLICFLIGGCR